MHFLLAGMSSAVRYAPSSSLIGFLFYLLLKHEERDRSTTGEDG